MMKNFDQIKVISLAGGVGGARMATGLAAILAPENLAFIVNTGDDFEHWGLKICPDLDTVLYNLAGKANPQNGWGLNEETFKTLSAVQELKGEDWFRIGDRDLATHLLRSELLRQGESLTKVTRILAERQGVRHQIFPMSDTACPTLVLSDEGEMGFQTYFVKRTCEPQVKSFRWENDEKAFLPSEAQQALETADLIILNPSNPFVSLDPILNRPGVRSLVKKKTTLAVSPILGGKVVKGPAAKMFAELGVSPAPSALDVARYYRDILDGFVLDTLDQELASEVEKLSIRAAVMPTLMLNSQKQAKVARGVLQFGLELLQKQG